MLDSDYKTTKSEKKNNYNFTKMILQCVEFLHFYYYKRNLLCSPTMNKNCCVSVILFITKLSWYDKLYTLMFFKELGLNLEASENISFAENKRNKVCFKLN